MFENCIKINNIMKLFTKPWFICGGWALDLFLDKETRDHEDIEIGIFREDQEALRKYLGNKIIYKTNPKNNYEKEIWKEETLRLPIHELY